MSTKIQDIKIDRPDIITSQIEPISYYRKMDTDAIVVALLEGKYILIEEFYSNGLEVLAELKNHLKLKYDDETPGAQAEYKIAFDEAAKRVILKIEDHKLLIKKAPELKWFDILYPESSEFYLPFLEVQKLSSSWLTYKNGVEVKTLDLEIHPFYGTHAPKRFDHLKLFDKWVKKYEGSKDTAIEIGIGSGVLSFQMIQNGFKNIHASDINKNAIVGVDKESKELGYEDKITLYHGDLFENIDIQADVIVFQPPWLPTKNKIQKDIDKAVYFEEDLFPKFFDEAKKHLSPEGKIVLVYSDLVPKSEENTHPIIEELRANNRFKKELHLRRDVRATSRRKKRNDSTDNKKVELWVLAQK